MKTTEKKTTEHTEDRDDAPKLTREWARKATFIEPGEVPPVISREKYERNGLVHVTVTRGGARPGAGRKPQAVPSQRFTITLPAALARRVHSGALKKKMKDASYLAELVAAHA